MTPVHSISLSLRLSSCHSSVLVECLLSALISLWPPHIIHACNSNPSLNCLCIAPLYHFPLPICPVLSFFPPPTLSGRCTWSLCCIFMRDVAKCLPQHEHCPKSQVCYVSTEPKRGGGGGGVARKRSGGKARECWEEEGSI